MQYQRPSVSWYVAYELYPIVRHGAQDTTGAAFMHRTHTHVQEGSLLMSMWASAPSGSSPRTVTRGDRALMSVGTVVAALLLAAPALIWHWQYVVAHSSK